MARGALFPHGGCCQTTHCVLNFIPSNTPLVKWVLPYSEGTRCNMSNEGSKAQGSGLGSCPMARVGVLRRSGMWAVSRAKPALTYNFSKKAHTTHFYGKHLNVICWSHTHLSTACLLSSPAAI